jgi:hypothetical protein
MIPSYMFYQLNSFSVGGWVKQVFAKTYEPLNSKFGGTPLTCGPHPESSLSGPTQPHLYSTTYIQIKSLL